jgi:ribosome-binding ATPase YchF (GTP1/OBG family)
VPSNFSFFFSEKITNIAPQKPQTPKYLIIKQAFIMTKAEIESKLAELKKQQGAHFQQKKAERNAESLKTIREEMNTLKAEVTKMYRGK